MTAQPLHRNAVNVAAAPAELLRITGEPVDVVPPGRPRAPGPTARTAG